MANLLGMGKKNYSIGIRIDEETNHILESMAKEDDRTVSYVIRKIIDEWLKMKGLKPQDIREDKSSAKKRA